MATVLFTIENRRGRERKIHLVGDEQAHHHSLHTATGELICHLEPRRSRIDDAQGSRIGDNNKQILQALKTVSLAGRMWGRT